MKVLKQFPRLVIGAILATSCTGMETVADMNAPQKAAASPLSPVGDSVTLRDVKGYSILIPEQATAQEAYSAAMLAEYLGTMYGTPLPVVQEPRGIKGRMISVGNTAAAAAANVTADPREQAYKLAVVGADLFILGGTRGPIYGVIALLEEDLGCRYYATGRDANDAGPLIPTRSKDELTVVPRSYAPPFEIREMLYWSAYSPSAKWSVFNRLQPMSYVATLMGPETGGGLANYAYLIHTYHRLVPADRYFNDHPEYFPLRGGKRHPSTLHDGALCYTSPGVVDVMVETLEAEIAKHPGTRIFSVSADDNVFDNCECPPCQEIIKLDGISGAQLYLANAVADKLAVKHPDIKITTLAYVHSQKPPKHIKPGPNTVIFYAPIRQRIDRIGKLLPIGDIEEIKDELAGWKEIASQIYLWDYVDIMRDVPFPFPNFDAVDRGWQFLMDNGVSGVFMQGSDSMRASLGELKCWLYAKMLWNPTWPQDELIEEFIAACYGPAAEEMAEYVALQRRAWSNFYRDRKPGAGLRFSPSEIQRMYQLLDTARVKSGGQADYTEKIERERLSLLCLSLDGHPTADTAADYANKLEQAEALFSRINPNSKGEVARAQGKLRKWRNMLKRATEGTGLPQYSRHSVTLKEQRIAIQSASLPDADAALGHATRQPGGLGWCVQWPFEDFLDLLTPGKVYIVRMRVKAEFNKAVPHDNGILFTLGAYTFGGAGPGIQGRPFPGIVSAADGDQYQWIELGRLRIDTPNAAGYLYCVPGRDLTSDDAVWYDYMEFVPEDEFKDAERAAKLPLISI